MNDFTDYADSPTAPALLCFEITPDDNASLAHPTKALYIGGPGDLVVRTPLSPADVTFRNLPAGYILDVRAIAVRATGTSATAIVGLA